MLKGKRAAGLLVGWVRWGEGGQEGVAEERQDEGEKRATETGRGGIQRGGKVRGKDIEVWGEGEGKGSWVAGEAGGGSNSHADCGRVRETSGGFSFRPQPFRKRSMRTSPKRI